MTLKKYLTRNMPPSYHRSAVGVCNWTVSKHITSLKQSVSPVSTREETLEAGFNRPSTSTTGFFFVKKKDNGNTLYWLPRSQLHYCALSLSPTSSAPGPGITKGSLFLHKTGLTKRIQLDKAQGGGWMKNCLLHYQGALWVSCYAIWPRQCTRSGRSVPSAWMNEVFNEWSLQRISV